MSLSITKKQLSALRRYFGVYTDTALGEKLGVSQPTIASWKKREIPNHILIEYADILGELVNKPSEIVPNREPNNEKYVEKQIDESADVFINHLKNKYKVYTDEELAKCLDVTQPAITHWRKRGVPKKILSKYKKGFKIANAPSLENRVEHLEKENKNLLKQIIELQREIIRLQKDK